MIYTADFETNVSPKNVEEHQTDVWLFDICNIDTLQHSTGNTIDEFMEKCSTLGNSIIYFHNLKFDGMFILNYLLTHGYTHVKRKPKKSYEFTTIISDMGVFYSIIVKLKSRAHRQQNIIEFRDSLKKINGSVEEIAQAFDLPIKKGSIDYTLYRQNPYTPTAEEISYIHNDTEIIARVMQLEYAENMTELTTASDTFMDYKRAIGKNYSIIFPVLPLEIDDFIRKSYRGGVCQVNNRYQGIELHNVIVYDVNSMYPNQMCNAPLPFGRPQYYMGKYKQNDKYPLYIQHIEVCCDCKDGYVPTILMKEHILASKDYLITTNGYMLELWLTSIDIELMFKHYNVYDIRYIDGYMFMASLHLFNKYLIPIYNKKCTTKGAEKQLNKLKLNALYGKFATNPRHYAKIPYLEDGIVKFKLSQEETSKPIYTAVSSFITAHARKQLFEAIQTHYNDFVYCDTDSVHLLCEMQPQFDVDDKRLGAWKLEKTFEKAKYLAQKTYYGIDTKTKEYIKIAGAPKSIKDKITFDNFKIGFTTGGKLIPKTVKGGVILYSTDFTIKERKKKNEKQKS